MDPQEMIDLILEYAEQNPNFDTSFVESLQEQLDRRGSLSSAQRYALENIIDKYGLDEMT